MTTLRVSGNAANQRGVTHRDKDDIGFGYFVENFGRDCGGARRNERIARIVEKIVAVLAREFRGAFARGRSAHVASLDYFCTKRDNARAFHWVWIFRKENRGANFCDARGVRNSGTVITRARGNNSCHRPLRRSGEQSVQRSARLE
jgi:hypothetical protein